MCVHVCVCVRACMCSGDFVLDCLCNSTYAECGVFCVTRRQKNSQTRHCERGRERKIWIHESMKWHLSWTPHSLLRHQCPHHHHHPPWDLFLPVLNLSFLPQVPLCHPPFLLSLSLTLFFFYSLPPWSGSDIGLKWDRV